MFEDAKKNGIPEEDMGLYVGLTQGVYKEVPGSERAKLRETIKQRRVIFGTYAMVAEGTDIPHLDTLILASPRSNVIQPVGRIRRVCEGKRTPLVLDLVDDDSWVFKKYAQKRLGWYQKIHCHVLQKT